MKMALVTGSGGLVGSAVTRRLLRDGWLVVGLDNNSRFAYFGQDGSVSESIRTLQKLDGYSHIDLDLTMKYGLMALSKYKFDAVVHAAAQPSHDLAARIPFRDFDVNARATLMLLELARVHWKEAPFVFFSTNKVYGDGPNRLSYVELSTRFDFTGQGLGIDEEFPVDHATHSLFGCSKLAADLYVQEYGRYFGLPTVSLRCGCLTGEGHAASELHGFLAYFARCAREGRDLTVYGYGGKQVRDNLHADDVAEFVVRFITAPRVGSIYNLGGGYDNSISILEVLSAIESISGKRPKTVTFSPETRKGDHRVYYSDLSKLKDDYGWAPTIDLTTILERLCRVSS